MPITGQDQPSTAHGSDALTSANASVRTPEVGRPRQPSNHFRHAGHRHEALLQNVKANDGQDTLINPPCPRQGYMTNHTQRSSGDWSFIS